MCLKRFNCIQYDTRSYIYTHLLTIKADSSFLYTLMFDYLSYVMYKENAHDGVAPTVSGRQINAELVGTLNNTKKSALDCRTIKTAIKDSQKNLNLANRRSSYTSTSMAQKHSGEYARY